MCVTHATSGTAEPAWVTEVLHFWFDELGEAHWFAKSDEIDARIRARFLALHERIVAGDRGWFFAQIADKVAEQRMAKGLSQRELAELCGTTQSAIARLERGGRPPRIDTLRRIAEALDCDLVVELEPRKH